ncbi:MAG: DUF2029 domain-containing protein [Opitutaceae bacterium]|nr:DUF2029 domain-containing protein [Opitutaceae bacterium]
MNAPEPQLRGGWLLRLLASRVRLAYVASAGLFLWCVAQFFQPETGFTSLISIGDLLNDSKVTALRAVPHHLYEASPGYDGAYYVQLALHPTLDNPELKKAIDNLPYRARRILFSWAAWALGLGQPAWIVQAHALLNVACWLALAWALLRWFPPTDWGNFLRWAAVMFSHGVIMSVRHSLVDGPSLLLVALALRWLEAGRGAAGGVTLALAGLGKETSLLATAATDFDGRAPRTWPRTAVTVALIALPLLAWMGFVRWRFGPAEDPGLGNFTWPMAGYAEKLGVAWREARGRDGGALHWATLGAVLALAVQGAFLLTRWRPADRVWRVGAAFAVMMLFLSTPVWEGYPGASTRVLLPMTLAFNLLVPRGARWLPVLIAGNLTVAASVFEFSPPHEFHAIRGEGAARAALRVKPGPGWHGPERHLEQRWRWSDERSELRLLNSAAQPLRVVMRARVLAAGDLRTVRVMHEERLLWADSVGSAPAPLAFGLDVPPGETVLVFSTDRPGEKIGTDPRALAFRVMNLEIVAVPAPGSAARP